MHPQTACTRWRDSQLAAEWAPIDLRFGAGMDLVLGVATGYRYEIDTVLWRRPPGYSPDANFARIAALLGSLRAVRGASRPFLLDTRDLVFQSDPLASIRDGRIRFFTEAAGQTFDRERTNRNWQVSSMGAESPALFGDFDINGVRPAIIHQYDRSAAMWRRFIDPDA
ncbi:MAG: hypothetical protein KIT43_05345 [Bauldia sp.]|nr:hypothetical protein [Bauldia sp.]